ncbi:MAG: hypothetical protein IIT98_07690 [Kiritimatiellae bacterium]|nr:hypothetical protein [Kiritimatiellia bacterium]
MNAADSGRVRRTAARAGAFSSACAALLSACFAAGCSSAPEGTLRYSGGHPLIRFTRTGLRFDGRPVTPEEAVALLEMHQIPKTDTIHLLVDGDYKDERAMWVFQHNYLGRAGYRRTVQVHERTALSSSPWQRERDAGVAEGRETPPPRR